MDSTQKHWIRSSLGWQQAYLKIVDKANRLVPLFHNVAQLKVHNTALLQRERGLPVRLIVLKARQTGISTYAEATAFEEINRRKNFRACIASADIDATEKVFQMCKTFQEEMPTAVRREPKSSNRKEITYGRPHRSGILCQTAGKDVLGRGGTTHFEHATEIAFWANAKRQLLGLLQEVPNSPDTTVILESTANGVGGEFHDRYWQAVYRMRRDREAYDGYLPIFLPWWGFPEYQTPLPERFHGKLALIYDEPFLELETKKYLASKNILLTDEQMYWRRLRIQNECGMDLSKFKQEYPATSREAFQSTGHSIFSQLILDRFEAKCKPPKSMIEFLYRDEELTFQTVLRRDDCWHIWQWPVRGNEYCFFGDVAEGIQADSSDPKSDPDFHACGILDRTSMILVATFHGRCDTILYGEQMGWAGMFYNNAVGSPEINSCGLAPLNELKRMNYPNIFIRKGKEEEYVEQDTPKLGWKTTTLTRKPMIEALKTVLVNEEIVIYDKRVIEELRVFTNKSGKPEAETGYHDDWVIMLAGLIQIHLLSPMEFADMDEFRTGYQEEEVVPASLLVGGGIDTEFTEEGIGEEDDDVLYE